MNLTAIIIRVTESTQACINTSDNFITATLRLDNV
jgi:hypothetical protein